MVALTRIAPTPSGFLHEGNRFSFRTTADLAATWGVDLALRIDDADAPRYRREYVEDIFGTLADLGIEWQVGPRDTGDFEAHWSQRAKTEYYRDELERARSRGLTVYACTCTRGTQRGPATGGCGAGCRNRSLEYAPGETALRVAVPIGTIVGVGQHGVDLAAEMGDFIVWRRDDLPAYQLVSVIEDRDLGTTHIVRGQDLLASSAAQIFLAPALGAANVAAAIYVHHELMTDGDGRKLSKSQIPREGP
jgi:glutamyl-tRNA synthetase